MAAALTARGKQSQEALLAVLLALAVMETFLSKRTTALHAAETLWMPVFVQGSDHFIQDGFVAMCTMGREKSKIVRLAVRPAVLFEKIAASQLGLAFSANKVLWVPHFAQRRHHLSHDRFLTR